ncbi:hypothetical protein DES53_11549 [Roseimicrobium gellanilyticum]|uniref:Uncharacterized protein n=1 Tax=Roseimicrobium gellanilyticum TaxID=748857 RepID=A0A366H4S3_9BACT|nr:hypothetical protein [Roseimicrobium gellanilyticum]RBP36908.1 hypothetical protein DES53_11549 [Roseimicrobium gellanilyticum]
MRPYERYFIAALLAFILQSAVHYDMPHFGDWRDVVKFQLTKDWLATLMSLTSLALLITGGVKYRTERQAKK